MVNTNRLALRPRRLNMRRREALIGFLFVLPAVIGFLIFTAGPVIASLGLSLTDYKLLSPPQWAGSDNYQTLLTDDLFWQSLKVTLIYAAVSLPIGLILSLGLALLMNQKLPGINFWRTVYYLPAVVSGVAVAALWVWILNPEFGVLNLFLKALGLRGPHWLADTRTALPALIVISLWSIGGTTVIYLAGLQSIPTELYEAAELDGATAWRRLMHVTLPMLSPVIFFNLVLGVIGAFQFFTEPFIMTKGGPENSTLTYMLYLYRNAFNYFKMGYASALAWVFFFIVFILTLVVFRSSSLWVYYSGERGR